MQMTLTNVALRILQVVLIIFIILGTIGNILNLLIFTRPKLSRLSCTQYLIAASISNTLVLYTALLTRLLADGFSMDITIVSNLFCKLRFYFCYVILALSPYFHILACFDRYCSSSASPVRRALCNKTVAKRLIIGAILLASVLYFHMAIFFEIHRSHSVAVCYARNGFYSVFYRIFYLIVYCMMPSFFMTLLCLLTLVNIRQQAYRVRFALIRGKGIIRQLDRHLILMLFSQIFTHFLCILPFAIMNLLIIFIETPTPLFEFFIQIFILLLFVSYSSSFYTFTLSSHIYRRELLNILQRRTAQWTRLDFSFGLGSSRENMLTRRNAIIRRRPD